MGSFKNVMGDDKAGLGSYHPWRHANVPLEILVYDGPVVSALLGHSL